MNNLPLNNHPHTTYKSMAITAMATILSAISLNAQALNRQGYVDKYSKLAVDEMIRTGIPASITIAQGILESDCGNSELAVEGNNHFGIKCHDWTGETIYHDDDRTQECFRKYPSAYDSFKDHSDFICQKSRYQSLFSLDRTDYQGWAYGLRAAGYATDPTYAKKLIDIIEELGLNSYDGYTDEKTSGQGVIRTAGNDNNSDSNVKPSVRVRVEADYFINPLHEHRYEYNNGVRYIKVMDGDSFDAIAREFHINVSELLSYNDLNTSADISEIKYLYIRSKKNRAHRDCVTHIVEEGDTQWFIAHKYGIKLRKLRRFNHLQPDDELHTGDVLNLRRSK